MFLLYNVDRYTFVAKNCVDCKNYKGVRIIFTDVQRNEKSNKHPELRKDDFLERIVSAVQKPAFVYEDLDRKDYYAYYFREFKINSRTRYTKVIARKLKYYHFIITAYRPDFVKERGKTKLLYGEDND